MRLGLLLARRWIVSTLLALLATLVMVRLGIWQLDRLEQRRAFNSRVLEQLEMQVLSLDESTVGMDLFEMEYRSVEVRGEYLSKNEVVLLNREWQGRLGVNLLTPLRIAETGEYVLVDRGWVPQEDYQTGNLEKYLVNGEQTVRGWLRRGESAPTFGGVPDPTLEAGQSRLEQWSVVNIERIASESGLALLPVYIQQLGNSADGMPPISAEPDLDLSEGPHMGYALQWFSFAAILLVGYPIFVNKSENLPDQTDRWEGER